MAKLVDIFADDVVRAMAMTMVLQPEKERAQTERMIRAHLQSLRVEQYLSEKRKRLNPPDNADPR